MAVLPSSFISESPQLNGMLAYRTGRRGPVLQRSSHVVLFLPRYIYVESARTQRNKMAPCQRWGISVEQNGFNSYPPRMPIPVNRWVGRSVWVKYTSLGKMVKSLIRTQPCTQSQVQPFKATLRVVIILKNNCICCYQRKSRVRIKIIRDRIFQFGQCLSL